MKKYPKNNFSNVRQVSLLTDRSRPTSGNVWDGQKGPTFVKGSTWDFLMKKIPPTIMF
jgi:hypothetical protein